MPDYEPTIDDLADVEMEDFDTAFDDSDAWVESILAGLSSADF